MRNNFLWGGAFVADQCEGAYNEDGKVLSIQDVMMGSVTQIVVFLGTALIAFIGYMLKESFKE